MPFIFIKFHHLKLSISCQKGQILLIYVVSEIYCALLEFTYFDFIYCGITEQHLEYSVFKRLVMQHTYWSIHVNVTPVDLTSPTMVSTYYITSNFNLNAVIKLNATEAKVLKKKFLKISKFKHTTI